MKADRISRALIAGFAAACIYIMGMAIMSNRIWVDMTGVVMDAGRYAGVTAIAFWIMYKAEARRDGNG